MHHTGITENCQKLVHLSIREDNQMLNRLLLDCHLLIVQVVVIAGDYVGVTWVNQCYQPRLVAAEKPP